MSSLGSKTHIGYTIETINIKKAKSVTKRVIKKNLFHDNYKAVLLNKEQKMAKQTTTGSGAHKGYMQTDTQLPYSNDNKRYILDDGIHKLAHSIMLLFVSCAFSSQSNTKFNFMIGMINCKIYFSVKGEQRKKASEAHFGTHQNFSEASEKFLNFLLNMSAKTLTDTVNSSNDTGDG